MTKHASFLCYTLVLFPPFSQDPKPQNNEEILEECKKKGIRVATVADSLEARAILRKRPHLLRSPTFRIISNNFIPKLPDGSPFQPGKCSAAEEAIRFLRSRRSVVPVLIYCFYTFQDAVNFVKEGGYQNVRVTKDYDEAETFALKGPVTDLWKKEM